MKKTTNVQDGHEQGRQDLTQKGSELDIKMPPMAQSTPTFDRNQSPSLIINLDQIGSPIEVKPPSSPESTLKSVPTSATDDSNTRDAPDCPLTATVTRLNAPNGAEIYLIGTAHFSPESVKDVQTVMRSVRPSSVILELCRERAFMLSLDEESLIEQNKKLSFDKIRSAIAEKGVAQGLIYIMFIKMSATLTQKLGVAPGAEFRAGSAEAQKIPGCNIILADRSLKVTVARAVASLSLWQKIKIIYQVMASDVTITQDEVEKCKDKDIVEQLLHEIGGEYPGFKRVLLDERNIFLAHSIYKWASNSETSHGPQRVVAIVGIGHVSGILEQWGKTTDDQIRELNQIPETSKTQIVVTKAVKYCTYALLLYLSYRILTPSRIQNVVHEKLFNISGHGK